MSRDDLLAVFERAGARGEALREDVLSFGDPDRRAAVVARWRADPKWLFEVGSAIERAHAEVAHTDAWEARVLASWTALFDEVLAAGALGDLPRVTSATLAAALEASRHDAAEDVAFRAHQEISRSAGPTSDATAWAALDLVGVRMDRGVFTTALLDGLLRTSASPTVRRRALGDLGLVHLHGGRYVEGLACWREAAQLPFTLRDFRIGGAGGDLRRQLVDALRHEIAFHMPTPELEPWGFGGPGMLVHLLVLSSLLSESGDPAARDVRTEAETRLDRGLAAWGSMDAATHLSTGHVAARLVGMLEARNLLEHAARVRRAARPHPR